MKKVTAILLLFVAAACAKREVATTDTVQSDTGVTASSTATTATTETSSTITPGSTSTPTPTATETVATAPPANVATAPGTPSATLPASGRPAKKPAGTAAPHVTATTATTATTAAPAPVTPAPVTPPPATTSSATPAATKEPAAASAPATDIVAGQVIFKTKCAGCHGADGRKNMKGVVLASSAIQNRSEAELEKGFRAGPQHKPMGLSDQQLRDVVAYVKALK